MGSIILNLGNFLWPHIWSDTELVIGNFSSDTFFKWPFCLSHTHHQHCLLCKTLRAKQSVDPRLLYTCYPQSFCIEFRSLIWALLLDHIFYRPLSEVCILWTFPALHLSPSSTVDNYSTPLIYTHSPFLLLCHCYRLPEFTHIYEARSFIAIT